MVGVTECRITHLVLHSGWTAVVSIESWICPALKLRACCLTRLRSVLVRYSAGVGMDASYTSPQSDRGLREALLRRHMVVYVRQS